MKRAGVVLMLGWLAACSPSGPKTDAGDARGKDDAGVDAPDLAAADGASSDAPAADTPADLANGDAPAGDAPATDGVAGEVSPGDVASDRTGDAFADHAGGDAPADLASGDASADLASGDVPGQVSKELSASMNRDLDILFMVDNSLSMMPLQAKLIASFPEFMKVFKNLASGLPNLHIAVISSDLGAGPFDEVDNAHCRHGGDQGVFQSVARGTCASSGLNPGQSFISNIAGLANYTGDITDVFSCIAALGDGGCGYEHQLASVLRALGADGLPTPPQNAGFLRANAYLAIVLITNEDDCSAPPDSRLFDPASRLVSDPLGPQASYRCNEFGHLCGGQRPPRTPAAATDLSGTCKSAEDGTLLRISDVAARIKALKSDPRKVLVASISGPPSPYVVKLTAPIGQDPNMWPTVDHSCTNGTSYGDPGVRIQDWVTAFGPNGQLSSICDDSLAPALTHIAQTVAGSLGAPCLEGKVVGGVAHPVCTVVEHVFNEQGIKVDTPLPSCADNGGAAPCWGLRADAACGAGSLVTFNRATDGGPAPLDRTDTVTCQVCEAGDTRAGCQ